MLPRTRVQGALRFGSDFEGGDDITTLRRSVREVSMLRETASSSVVRVSRFDKME